ncbi:hypothetical protein IAQ61_011656 [Plenodomus lingam]|uniref:uncharacterized protein n=1 Tax=Leptosphaeria maculans TaxID=5022 RepID=UPI003321C003|nr:hypothetical protein IAQ61_011656 [Plenodomus lingam]
MASSLQQMAATITERSRTLINNDLKKILKEEGSSQTGNKAALQTRVISLINNAVQEGNADLLRRLQYRIQHHGEAPRAAAASSPSTPSFPRPTPPAANGYSMAANGYQASGSPYSAYQQPHISTRPNGYFFKDSPFFEIRELIMSNISLDASPSHRQSVTRTLIPSEHVAARLKSDKSLRLLLFSALEQPLAPYARLDISFPSQIEVRINAQEVKANYKGLKNKPGSTRPADITEFVRITPTNHRNSLVITYALTQKASQQKYNLFIYMVKKFSVEELTRRIKLRNLITRQSVLNEMLKNANDPDIEVGSSVMSLKDPISTLRIQTPCRSTVCTHNQCFDAESFLQLQEQAPTWTCPICNKTISYEALAVDQYVEEILNKARNVDQVTIEPNGDWSLDKEASPKRNDHSAHGAHDDDSDEDLVEIPDYRIRAIRSEAIPTPTSLSTPPQLSRDSSMAPRSGQKRTSEVVDLTLSDDEEPVRPAKKVAYSTPNSFPDLPRRQLPPLGHSSYGAHSRPIPPAYGVGSSFPRPSATPTSPPPRTAYVSYRPAPPATRPQYSRQGSANHPTYLDSSP